MAETGTIGSKAEVKALLAQLPASVNEAGLPALLRSLEDALLDKKIRFPLLEYAAGQLYALIPAALQIKFTGQLIGRGTLGGYVIAGMLLQHRLPQHFDESIAKAKAYIIAGDTWYVCDIIGERVMGHALLTQPQNAVKVMRQLATDDNKWIVRCVGVATHYAVKKGLPRAFAEEMFGILLSLAGTTEFHTKKGIGWAAKTIAKFYPAIIEANRQALADEKMVRQWFRTKIKIGLGRASKYAGRYPG